jgi:hypothetical protein
MANSKTDIINKALVLVGAATVVSIDDGTPNANTLGNVYEIALQSILSECKWNFATKRANLSVSATSPDFLYSGEKVVYDLPSDVIRIYQTNPASAYWREEDGQVISDSVNLGIAYVYYDENPNDYPSYFLDAFIDKLCADIAYTIINSATIAEKFVNKYERMSLPKAISANSQTGAQQTMQDDYWVLAKYRDGETDL